MRRASILPLLILAAACRPSGGSALSIEAPGQLRFALNGRDLCSQLDAKFSFLRTGSTAPGNVKDVPLTRVDASDGGGDGCTWVLEKDRQLVAGTYDLVVRFETQTSFGTCADHLLVGMYARRAVHFPFSSDGDGGFKPLSEKDDYYDQPNDGKKAVLAGLNADFDVDGDQHSNLGEVIDGTDPCHANSVPAVSLDGVHDLNEGDPLALDVRTSDLDKVPHRVLLRIVHGNGAQNPPNPLFVTFSTDSAAAALVEPNPVGRPWREQWNLVVDPINYDTTPGSGHWKLVFTPDEPFVGTLTAQVSALDGSNTTLNASPETDFKVSTVDGRDPPMIQLSPDAEPVSSLNFTEQGTDQRQFQVVDRRLGSPSTLLTPTLPANAPAGLAISPAGDKTWVLAWSPTNEQALAGIPPPPPPGLPGVYVLEFPLLSGGAPVAHLDLTLNVTPLVNDAPIIVPPAKQALALPEPPQAPQTWPAGAWPVMVHFTVQDPDRVDSPPSCTVTAPAKMTGGACANPFGALSCGTIQKTINGDSWDFAIAIDKGPGYEACAHDVTFSTTIKVTDVSPTGQDADKLSQTLTLVDTSTGKGLLHIAGVAVESVITGVPSGSFGAFVDGSDDMHTGQATGGRAVVVGDSAIAVVDLTGTSAGVKKTFLASEVVPDGSLSYSPSWSYGAVDTVRHRVVLTGQFVPGDSDEGLAVFFLQSSPPTVKTVAGASMCTGMNSPQLTNPVITDDGSAWFACTDPGAAAKLIKVTVDAGGAVSTSIAHTGTWGYGFSYQPRYSALVHGSTGPWMVIWAAKDTFRIYDLTALTSMDFTAPTGDGLEDLAVDTERGAYLYTYQLSHVGYLGRIVIGASPVASTPIALGPSLAMAMALRRPYSAPPPTPPPATPSPHLIVTPGEDYYSPDTYLASWIDLTSWSADTGLKTGPGYHFGNCTVRFFESPDRRFFIQPIFQYPPSSGGALPLGFLLHRYDKGADANEILEDGLDNTNVTDIVTSREGNVSVVLARQSQLYVLEFPEAAAGTDQ